MKQWKLWYCPNFPVSLLEIKPASADNNPKWSQRFLDDIRKNGLRNPLVVHRHLNRRWLIMVGNNRHWAARMLGMNHVPVVVSVPPRFAIKDIDPNAQEVVDLQSHFQDGIAYENDRGWGVHSAPMPEKTYAESHGVS